MKTIISITSSILVTICLLSLLPDSNVVSADCLQNQCIVTYYDDHDEDLNDCWFDVVLCTTYQDTFIFFYRHSPSSPWLELVLEENGFCNDGCYRYKGKVEYLDCQYEWEWGIRDAHNHNPCP